ncbi:hypothetical protein OIU74_026978, partial [Salix koriyanagi]
MMISPFHLSKSNIFYLKLITGHGFTPAAGNKGRTMGTLLTTENASLRRAARLMKCDTF